MIFLQGYRLENALRTDELYLRHVTSTRGKHIHRRNIAATHLSVKEQRAKPLVWRHDLPVT